MRRIAALGLGRIGPKAELALPRLLIALKNDRSGVVRCEAAIASVLIDPEGRTVVPSLIGALDDQSEEFIAAAGRGLGMVGAKARAAVPRLIQLLHDHRCSYYAAEALGLMGADARSALPVLSKMMTTDENPVFRIKAAQAIVRIDPKNHESMRSIINAFEVQGEVVHAAGALIELGPVAGSAVPALIRSLKSKDEMIRFEAVALGSIGDRTAVPALKEALKDEDPNVRDAAEEALEKMTSPQSSAVLKRIPLK